MTLVRYYASIIVHALSLCPEDVKYYIVLWKAKDTRQTLMEFIPRVKSGGGLILNIRSTLRAPPLCSEGQEDAGVLPGFFNQI